MSTKFEQLLDYLVNEEMDKANELFHEIVVEKSRSIYENLIAEEDDEEMDEAADDEEMDEAREEDDEEMDESMEDEEMDESEEDLEDSYMMDAEDDGFGGGDEHDPTDALGMEVGADHDEEGGEGDEDSAMMDIKNAIEELEAAFAELEQAQGSENGDMDMDSEFGDEEDGEDDEMEMMGMPMENRRITREYREKVGNDWDKNSQKTQGQALGANTGESFPSPTEGKSPISSGSGKPTTGANAKNLNQGATEGQSNTGTSPNKVTKGINPDSGEQYTKGVEKNIASSSTAKMKDGAALNKQGSGYPSNNKAPKPVGSGTGELAGQTSVSHDKPFLKKL